MRHAATFLMTTEIHVVTRAMATAMTDELAAIAHAVLEEPIRRTVAIFLKSTQERALATPTQVMAMMTTVFRAAGSAVWTEALPLKTVQIDVAFNQRLTSWPVKTIAAKEAEARAYVNGFVSKVLA